jgi:hypothetical protein
MAKHCATHNSSYHFESPSIKPDCLAASALSHQRTMPKTPVLNFVCSPLAFVSVFHLPHHGVPIPSTTNLRNTLVLNPHLITVSTSCLSARVCLRSASFIFLSLSECPSHSSTSRPHAARLLRRALVALHVSASLFAAATDARR